jgi:hypothetical protein
MRLPITGLLGLVLAGLLSLLGTAMPQQAPPRVVATSPADGSGAVDPDVQELRVVFDQAMDARAGHSFVGGGDTFPEITGDPRWVDDRTVVLPIRLKPDHAYQLSINSERFTGFRNMAGEPALPHPVRFATAGGPDAPALTPEVNRRSILQVRAALRDRYAHRDVHQADWTVLFTAAADELAGAKSPAAFAAELADVLAAAGDVHIAVKVGQQLLGTHQPAFKPNFNGQLVPRIVPNFTKKTESIYTGRYDDGVGYILIATLQPGRGAEPQAIIDALRGMADAPAIILDLRPNGGGDERIAQQVAGLFIERPSVYAKHVSVDPAAAGGFGATMERVLTPSKAGFELRQPVAVLMGPNNMSSAEAFVLMMRQVPQAKLFGTRTYGSSGNPQPVELANGVTVLLPSWKAMDAEGAEFEGKGIAPDVEVKTTPQELAERDVVLEAALEWARSAPGD